MNNSNLSTLNISDDIRKEFTIDSTGKGKTTLRGASRLLGITDKLVRPPLAVKLTQELRNAGFEGASFEDGVTDVEFTVLALYVAFESSSTNPQAVAIVKTLTAIGARSLFQSIVGWEPKQEHDSLPSATDWERVENMSVCSARRDETPQDKINLPGWLTVTEMLIAAGEDENNEYSLLKNDKFRFWINRQLADIYRAQYGSEPPSVNRRKSTAYCYPPSFQSLATLYRSNWINHIL